MKIVAFGHRHDGSFCLDWPELLAPSRGCAANAGGVASASPSLATATGCWRAKRREPEATGGMARARLDEIHESNVAKRQQHSATQGIADSEDLLRESGGAR